MIIIYQFLWCPNVVNFQLGVKKHWGHTVCVLRFSNYFEVSTVAPVQLTKLKIHPRKNSDAYANFFRR